MRVHPTALFIYNVTISVHDKSKFVISAFKFRPAPLFTYSGSPFRVCPASEVQPYISNSFKNRNNHLLNDFVSDICFKSIRIVSDRANKHWLDYSFLFSHNYLYAWAGLPGLASLLEPLRQYLIFKCCIRSSMTLTWTRAF